METEGEGHHNFNIDLLGEFVSKFYLKSEKKFKTSVVFVLFKITEKYDGITNYLINSLCDLIEFIANDGIEKMRIDMSVYNLPFDREFILRTKEELLIDMCFFVFNCLCKNFVKSTQFSRIKLIIYKYQNELLRGPTDLVINPKLYDICKEDIIIDKIYFMIGLYSESLLLTIDYSNSQQPKIALQNGYADLLIKLIPFLFKGVLNFNNLPGSSYQACFSLRALIKINSAIKIEFIKVIKTYLLNIIKGIEEVEIPSFFDVIGEMIHISKKEKSNLLELTSDNDECNKTFNFHEIFLILEACIKRCLLDLKGNKRKESLHIFTKCLNIISYISEEYVISDFEYQNTNKTIDTFYLTALIFEKSIVNITTYLKNPSKFDYDSEVVQIIANIQKKSNVFLESTGLIYFNIKKIFNKGRSINKAIYDILYELIEKGRNFLMSLNMNNSNDEDFSNNNTNITKQYYYDVIIELVIDSLDDTDEETSYFYGSLLLQKLLQVSLFLIFRLLLKFLNCL